MPVRCYTVAKIRELLDGMPRSTFYDLLKRGRLPYVEEILPRSGRLARYRAGPIDEYLQNRWRPPSRRARQAAPVVDGSNDPSRKTKAASTAQTLTRQGTERMDEPEANSATKFEEPQP